MPAFAGQGDRQQAGDPPYAERGKLVWHPMAEADMPAAHDADHQGRFRSSVLTNFAGEGFGHGPVPGQLAVDEIAEAGIGRRTLPVAAADGLIGMGLVNPAQEGHVLG